MKMKKRMKTIVLATAIVAASIVAIGLLSLTPGAVSSRTDTLALSPQMARMQFSLSFEANHGQTAAEVDFLARGPGYTVFLQPTAAVLSLRGSVTGERQGPAPEVTGSLTKDFSTNPKGEGGSSDEQSPVHGESRSPAAALRMEIVEANPQSRPMGRSRLPGLANYFIGNDPEGWRTNVPTFGKVRYEEVYDGIDLVYYGTDQRKLEYDFVVAPGADPSQIALSFDGADEITLDDDGNLHIRIASFADSSDYGNEVVFEKPYSYQESDSGERLEIPSAFVLAENRLAGKREKREKLKVRFELGSYDTARPLTIDPTLVYSSYLGGSVDEWVSDIAVDSLGNAYLVGMTNSTNFPTTAGSFQVAEQGSDDGFITKVSANGLTIIYSTYVGGVDSDYVSAVEVDGLGNVYVTGRGSTGFPTTAGSIKEMVADFQEPFLLKLNPTGDTLVYSTLIPFGQGGGADLAFDGDGQVYVVSHDNVCTAGYSNKSWLTKVNSTGTAVIYQNALGFAAVAVDIDSTGHAYIFGQSNGTAIPVNAIQPVYAGARDAFLAKLDPTGASFVFATYLGGSGTDNTAMACPLVGGRTESIDVNESEGTITLAGSTRSLNFPMIKPSLQGLRPCCSETFFASYVAKITMDGSEILYSTQLGRGGGGGAQAARVATDQTGNAYVTSIRIGIPIPDGTAWDFTGNIAKLNAGGCRTFAVDLTGPNLPGDNSGNSILRAVAVDSSGDAYFAGSSSLTDYPTVSPFQEFAGGGFDAVITKITGMPDLVGCNPLSRVTGLFPPMTWGGIPGYTLTVRGRDFQPDSVVRWNGADRFTTFVDSTELQGEILNEDLPPEPGRFVEITVFTPAPGGGPALPMKYLVAAVRPTIMSMSPASQSAGSAGFTMTVLGEDFLDNAVVRWNGQDLATTVLSRNELEAFVPATRIAVEGTVEITVLNPDPNGEGSISTGFLTFTIGAPGDNPVPAITSVSPPNGNIGAASMSLTLTGTGFISGSVGRWDGADRPTTFVSDTQVDVVVTSADLAVGGVHQLTVFNPAPGGGESAAKNFNVVNPGPKLTAISPSNLDAGGGDFTLTVDGSDFIGDSVVYWNGGARTTTFVSGGQLTATIPASDISAGGESQVTINTPAPGGGNSNAAMFTVDEFTTAPTAGQPTSATVPAGGSANFGFTIAPSGSFDQPVTFSCTGLPEQSSCSFSPAQVTPGADPTGVTLTISTTAEGTVVPLTRPAPPTLPLPLGMLAWLTIGLLSLSGLALAARQKRFRPRLAVAALLLLGLVATACGTAAQPLPGTPPGIYTITVNATSGNLTKTLGFTLTVN